MYNTYYYKYITGRIKKTVLSDRKKAKAVKSQSAWRLSRVQADSQKLIWSKARRKQVGSRMNAARYYRWCSCSLPSAVCPEFPKKKSENRRRSCCSPRLCPPEGCTSSFHHQANRIDMNIPGQQQTQPSAATVTSLSGVCWDATSWEGWEHCRSSEESVVSSRPTNLEPAQSRGWTEKV